MFQFRLLSALKNRRERHSGQPAIKARRPRLTLESLEDRCLMSASVAAPPAPVGVPVAFAVGIGPGMQLDFFETDQAGQVFAQPVLNLFGHFGATTFINSQVEIPTLIPQDGGPPLITVQGSNGQQYMGWLTNPSDPHVLGPAMNALFGPFAGFLGGGNGGSSQTTSNGGGGTTNGGGGTTSSSIAGTYVGDVNGASVQPANLSSGPYHITLTINANGSGHVTLSPDPVGFSTDFTGQVQQNADGTVTLVGNVPNGSKVELTEAKIINGNQLNGNFDIVEPNNDSISFDATDGDTGAPKFVLTKQ